ncbi:MAG TPA: XRE family transcriptional regulator [Solirubrobacteraceae bacterium]
MNDMFYILHDQMGAGIGAQVGANLRRLRIASRQSLSELARATKVSKATLSGIERGAANPTIQTLAALAGALRVPVTELIQAAPVEEVRIVRGEQRNLDAGQPVVRELDLSAVQGRLDIRELILPAGHMHEEPPAPTGSRVHLWILEGVLIAGPRERISELESGDYCSFPTDVAHIYETGRHRARALVFAYSPG